MLKITIQVTVTHRIQCEICGNINQRKATLPLTAAQKPDDPMTQVEAHDLWKRDGWNSIVGITTCPDCLRKITR